MDFISTNLRYPAQLSNRRAPYINGIRSLNPESSRGGRHAINEEFTILNKCTRRLHRRDQERSFFRGQQAQKNRSTNYTNRDGYSNSSNFVRFRGSPYLFHYCFNHFFQPPFRTFQLVNEGPGRAFRPTWPISYRLETSVVPLRSPPLLTSATLSTPVRQALPRPKLARRRMHNPIQWEPPNQSATGGNYRRSRVRLQ